MTTIAMMMTRMEAWVGGNTATLAPALVGSLAGASQLLDCDVGASSVSPQFAHRGGGSHTTLKLRSSVISKNSYIYSIPILIQAPKTFYPVSPQLAQRGGGSHNMGVTQLVLTGDRQTHLSQKVYGDLET